MNILGKLDNKLRASARDTYLKSEADGIKPHATWTFLAIACTYAPFYFAQFFTETINFENETLQSLASLFIGLLALGVLYSYVFVIYLWIVHFTLKRESIIKNKNDFFAESAGLKRKFLFYLSLIPWLVMNAVKYLNPEDIGQHMERMRYQLRADFYQEAGLTILENILFSIWFIELARILFPKTSSWSNKKHAVIVILASIVISAIRVSGLYRGSGHGIM